MPPRQIGGRMEIEEGNLTNPTHQALKQQPLLIRQFLILASDRY